MLEEYISTAGSKGKSYSRVVYCGWLCPECCEKYGWVEDRIPEKNHYASCENCRKVHVDYVESE